MRHRAVWLAIGLLAMSSEAGWTQQHRQRGFPGAASGAAGPVADSDIVLATASEWGGANGVYTCEEWRQYLQRMYNLADKRHRGFIDAQDFAIIPRVSPVFRAAGFDYFDMAGKGRVSRQEFLAFPSPFFARFDKKHACRVTQDDIRRTQAAPAAPSSEPSSRGDAPGMGRGGAGGFGGGGFGGAGGFGR